MGVNLDEGFEATFDDLAAHPHVSSYLQTLEQAVTGYVPDPEVHRLVEETSDHLVSLIFDLEETVGREESVARAICEMGSPQAIADYFIEAWYTRPSRLGALEKRLGPGRARTLIWFGTAEILLWVLLQARVFLPAYGSVQLPWSPATVRQYFPEPLPFPDFSLRFLLLIVLPLILPPILGYAVGRQVPVRPHLEVAKVTTLMLLMSYALGLLLLPLTDGLILGLLQLVYWLPVATLSAYLGHRSRRVKPKRNRLEPRLA